MYKATEENEEKKQRHKVIDEEEEKEDEQDTQSQGRKSAWFYKLSIFVHWG